MTKPKKEKITGYKVFNHDWTCRGFKYKIGKTYTHEGEISLCDEGFHFCKNLMDCFEFYDCVTWNKIAKVEALGEVKTDDKKCVTNEKFNEVWKIFHKKLNGWVPTFNNLKSLYLKSGSSWKLTPIPNAKEISKKEAWGSMPKEAIEYIKSLEEFDKDMFEEITGIEV